MTLRGFGVAAFTAVMALAWPAAADFNDNQPINYTVDGATATGYFKVVTEAINGIVREAYPGLGGDLQAGQPGGRHPEHLPRPVGFHLQRRRARDRLCARRQGAVHGIAEGQVPASSCCCIRA